MAGHRTTRPTSGGGSRKQPTANGTAQKKGVKSYMKTSNSTGNSDLISTENISTNKKGRSPFDILAKPNVITVPKAEAFIADEADANSWGIPTMIKYLKCVIELPQYEEVFLKFEVNGFAYLCLAKDIIPQLGIKNSIHSAKIAVHAGIVHVYTCNIKMAPLICDHICL